MKEINIVITEKKECVPGVISITTITLSKEETEILAHLAVFNISYGYGDRLVNAFHALINKGIITTSPEYEEVRLWHLSNRGKLLTKELSVDNKEFLLSIEENRKLKTEEEKQPSTGGM